MYGGRVDPTVTVASKGDWTIVSVGGEIDVATAPALRERMIDLISDGSSRLVLDLDGVDFLDSTGLGVIVGALKRARGNGGDVRVACRTGHIRKVFELTGLDRALLLADTVDDAIG